MLHDTYSRSWAVPPSPTDSVDKYPNDSNNIPVTFGHNKETNTDLPRPAADDSHKQQQTDCDAPNQQQHQPDHCSAARISGKALDMARRTKRPATRTTNKLSTQHKKKRTTRKTVSNRTIRKKNTKTHTHTDLQTDRQKNRKQDKTDGTTPSAIHMSPLEKLTTSLVTTQICVKHCSTDMVS